jgi:hypothetical protein
MTHHKAALNSAAMEEAAAPQPHGACQRVQPRRPIFVMAQTPRELFYQAASGTLYCTSDPLQCTHPTPCLCLIITIMHDRPDLKCLRSRTTSQHLYALLHRCPLADTCPGLIDGESPSLPSIATHAMYPTRAQNASAIPQPVCAPTPACLIARQPRACINLAT